MKKFAVLTLATLLSAQAFAGSVCETAYETKIGNFTEAEYKSNLRSFGATLGGNLGFLALLVAINPAGIVAAAGFIAVNGVSFGMSQLEDKRQDSILEAYGVVKESGITREAFIDVLEKKHDEYQNYEARHRLYTVNGIRRSQGLPAQTLEEYIKVNPLTPFNRDLNTNIDSMVNAINKKRSEKVSYEQVSRAIQNVTADSEICSGETVPRMKKITKLVKQNL